MWGQTRLSAGEKAWGPLSDRQHCQLGKLIHQPSIPVSIQSALVHWLLMTLITIENKMMDKLIPKQSRKDEEWSPLQKGGKVFIVIIAYTFIVIIGRVVWQIGDTGCLGSWYDCSRSPTHLLLQLLCMVCCSLAYISQFLIHMFSPHTKFEVISSQITRNCRS